MIIKNEMLSWPNAGMRRESLSDITIHENNGKYIVIATEREDNTGFSVTNGAEQLWQKVVEEYSLKEEDCIFVETYYWSDEPQRWDQVIIKNGKATWAPIPDFKKMLAEFGSEPKEQKRLEKVD